MTDDPMKCPRAQSCMTPCYLRDGDLAVVLATQGWGAGRRKVCVGCDYGIGLINATTKPEKPDGRS